MLRTLLTIGFLQFLTMLVMLVRTKTLALVLGPEYVGMMSTIDKLLAVISQTLSLSLPFAALRFLPEALRSSPAAFHNLLRRMRNVLLVLAVPFAVVAAGIAFRWPGFWGAQFVPYRDALFFALLGLPVAASVPFLTNAFAGRMRQYQSMLFALGHAMVLTVSAVIGAWWRGLEGVYLVYAMLGLGLVIVAYWLVGRPSAGESPDDGAGGGFSLRLPAAMWRFSLALLSVTFALPYAAFYVNYSVLSRFGAEATGWLQAAIGLSLSVRTLLGSAHAVFLTPNVNRQGAPADRMTWANRFQHTNCLLFVLALPPLLLFPHLAVRILYSSAFLPGATLAALFIAAEVTMLLSGTYQSLIIAGNHMALHVVQNLLAQLLLMGTASLLLPRIGMAGAGIATLATPIFLYLTTVGFLHWRYGLRVPRDLTVLSLYVAGVVAVSGVIGARMPEFTPTVVGVKVLVYIALTGLGFFFLTPGDRDSLSLAWRRSRRWIGRRGTAAEGAH
jgi:O-antigen/teichoic acid export membrane protein